MNASTRVEIFLGLQARKETRSNSTIYKSRNFLRPLGMAPLAAPVYSSTRVEIFLGLQATHGAAPPPQSTRVEIFLGLQASRATSSEYQDLQEQKFSQAFRLRRRRSCSYESTRVEIFLGLQATQARKQRCTIYKSRNFLRPLGDKAVDSGVQNLQEQKFSQAFRRGHE